MPLNILEGPDGRPVTAKGNADGAQVVEVSGDVTIAGGATEAKQDVAIASLDAIEADADATRVAAEATAAGQSSLATAANQSTANGFLTTIAAAMTITLSALRDAIVAVLEAIRDRLPGAFGAGGGIKIDGSGTALPVTGSITATISGAVDTELPSAAALADNAANPTVPGVGAFGMMYDSGASPPWQRLRGNAAGGLYVQGATANGVAVSGVEKPVLVAGWDGGNKQTIPVKNTEPLVADYGVRTRQIPNKISTAKTVAGTPAASLVVRAGPCWLFDIFVSNQSPSTACYVALYDAIAAPSHGGSAAARKIVGRRIGTKAGTTPLNFKEQFGGMYFSLGCVMVLEMAEDDALVNTSGAPACAMSASFIAAT